jgi:hypothetical protein
LAFCTQCGKNLRDGAKFCTQCGTKVKASRVPTRSSSPARSSPSQPTRRPETSYKAPIVFRTRQQPPESETSQDQVSSDDKDNIVENTPELTTEVETSLPPSESEDFFEEDSELINNDSDSSLENENTISDASISTSEPLSQDDIVKNRLKEQLLRIKYSFREIDELEPFLFRTTFIAGSIKDLIWDFTSGFNISAKLPENVNSDVIFSLELKEDRQAYDWKDPYNFVIFNTEIKNESIIKKIKREGRMIEKLSRIKGSMKAEITGQKISLNISTLSPDNIRLALDAVKEIAWLMDITLK